MNPQSLDKKLAPFDRISICGLELLNISEADCVDLIVSSCEAGLGGWVVTPNTDILRKCTREPEIRELCSRADILIADGMPLIWASRIQGTPLHSRVPGSDLIVSLSGEAARHSLKVFLLGGAPGVVEHTATVLLEKFPSTSLAGTYCPPFGFEEDEEEIARIEDALEQSEADIVFVALGFPKSERLIERLRPHLPFAWWIGVGISFSFLSGHVRRAPKWAQMVGAEWVFRLSQEPSRLARRYLIEDLPFAFLMLANALRKRLRWRVRSIDSRPKRGH